MKEKLTLSKIYDTVLSIPGMHEPVKLNLSLPRKQIFFLHKIIERGLSKEPGSADPLDHLGMPDGLAEDLLMLSNDLLTKAGLKEMNDKIRGL